MFESRMVNAKMPLVVWMRKPDGGYVDLGITPAEQDIVIPECVMWGVRTGDRTQRKAERRAKVMLQENVPGVWLEPGSGIKCVAAIALLGHLRELRFGQAIMWDSDMHLLDGFHELELLDLSFNFSKDSGLMYLQKMRKLENLDLTHNRITDVGLEELARLDTLRDLDLAYTKVTDAGLKSLERLQNLRTLDLTHTKVTAAGAQALGRALPRCEIDC